MKASAAVAPAALAFAMAACAGNPQRLPVGVSICNAVRTGHGLRIEATVQNESDRPISQLNLATAFYRDFRYARFAAFTQLDRELDPGQKRTVEFVVTASGQPVPQGEAIRCFITHIGYLDGTSADAPPEP